MVIVSIAKTGKGSKKGEGSVRKPIVVHEAGRLVDKPMVLVHGITDAGTAWPDAITHWTERAPQWHIYSVSLRGHGESPRFAPQEHPRMMEIWVDDLVEVLEGLGQPAVVVGHSLGGRTAVKAALRRPDLVKALVLEDPALPDTTPERRAEIRSWRIGLLNYETKLDREVKEAEGQGWSRVEAEAWARAHTQVDLEMMANLELGPMNAIQTLQSLARPTLIVAPRGSRLIPSPDSISNPLVEFMLLDGVGHCVRRDAPETFFAAVDGFLTGE